MNLWYWLISHGIFRYETDKEHTAFLFELYKQEKKNSIQNQKQMKERLHWIVAERNQPVDQFPDLSQFADPEPLKMKGHSGCPEKGISLNA